MAPWDFQGRFNSSEVLWYAPGVRGNNLGMLLSKQIANLAAELRDEASRRPYVKTLIPQVAEDEVFWRLIVEMLELVIHRQDFVVVERHRVDGNLDESSAAASPAQSQ